LRLNFSQIDQTPAAAANDEDIVGQIKTTFDKIGGAISEAGKSVGNIQELNAARQAEAAKQAEVNKKLLEKIEQPSPLIVPDKK
jgi:hypothetical protein